MNPIILTEATQRLMADYAFKKSKSWLQQGKCPACGQKELFASAEAPWVLKCGRLNNCGHESSLRDLYPDLFESWSDRFKADDKNPNAAADAYLKEARGFDISKLKGLYSQENYYNRDLNIGSATVRFNLADGYWERIIDKAERFKPRKANFKYGWNYEGLWWTLPNSNFIDALDFLIPLGENLKDSIKSSIVDLAVERQQRINQEHPVIQKFWEIYEYIENKFDKPTLNHADPRCNEIAINLPHFLSTASDHKLYFEEEIDLKNHLKQSRHYRFIESNKSTRSCIYKHSEDSKTIKCWIFKKPTTKSN